MWRLFQFVERRIFEIEAWGDNHALGGSSVDVTKPGISLPDAGSSTGLPGFGKMYREMAHEPKYRAKIVQCKYKVHVLYRYRNIQVIFGDKNTLTS